MKDDEFKAWLLAGGAKTEAGRSTRAHAVRTIEKNLAALGSPHADLDAAWGADRFEQLRARLKELREDFAAGGADYRLLMPQSTNPENRLSSWRSWLGQYGQFLSGAPRGDRDADLIRRHVLETYIEPARGRDADTADVLVRDVNEALGLNQAWPNICQALAGSKFAGMSDVSLAERIGADQSSATVFRFDLIDRTIGVSGSIADRPFILYDAAGTAFRPVRNFNRATGVTAYRIKPPGANNETDQAIEVETIAEVARAMLKEGRPSRIQSVIGGPVNYLGYGKQKLVRYELDPVIAARIGVPPTGRTDGSPMPSAELSADIQDDREMPIPTNLILYGPPGTGKTYATARKAVELCGESAPDDRDELMAVYRSLQQKGRIAFVTFHQSYSYEEFVEGLRPVSGGGEADGVAGAGFSLQPQDGTFKQIADVAASNRGRAAGGATASIDRTAKIFKMSLGRSWAAEDDAIFQDALREGYVVLGWGGEIDWSDPRYDAWDAIAARWREDHPEASGNDPNITQLYALRANMQVGSLVVISDGNRKFRAIGRVAGPYQFVRGPNGDYNHRRAVNWLWRGEESLSRELIYNKELSQVSAYQMNSRQVNWDGLEQVVASGGDAGATVGAPEPYVLIIDEINRANISKVFGELITLLEPDKRLGRANELTVRLPYSKTDFGVPANLHIIGTMNTADRSIALLDTALRRRFAFEELMPEPKLLRPVDGIDLPKLLATINERVEYLFDREHQIGHAYFIGCASRADVDAAMRHRVIPLLAEYFYEDWGKVARVLGDAGDGANAFLLREKLAPPPGLDGDYDDAPRYRWSVREEFDYEAFAAA